MSDTLSRWTETALAAGLRLAGILAGAAVLIWVLRVFTRRLVEFASSESRAALLREQQTRTLAGILNSAGTAVIVAIAVVMALPEFGINVTPIAAAAGLASLALGFGAQHLVRDLINGFFIVFEDQYVVGDVIRVGDVVGRVEHLTLRRTVVRDVRGALVTLPNGEIRQVANVSRDWSQVFVDVTVDAEAEVSRALEALEQAAAELRADPAWTAVLVDGPRVLGVESVGPQGTVLRVQARTAPTRQDDVAREFRRRAASRLAQAGVPFSATHRLEMQGKT
jgi:small conductance mechanosensitive channel